MTSASLPRRLVIAERARMVRNIALAMVALLLVIWFLVSIWVEDASSAPPTSRHVHETMAVLVMTAVSISALAQIIRLVAMMVDDVHARHHRSISPLGDWARLVCRCSVTVIACAWLMSLVIPVASIAWRGPPGAFFDLDDPVTAHLHEAVGAAFAAAFLCAVVSGLLWCITEAIAGYRERREPMNPPEAPSHKEQQPLN